MRLPAGVGDGQRIRLKGRGGPGRHGGPAGDLFVLVHVDPDELFGREGDNLTLTVPVTLAEAALGSRLTRADARRWHSSTLKLPEGTPSGKVLRVKGRGVATEEVGGDLLVTVQVAVPSDLDRRAATGRRGAGRCLSRLAAHPPGGLTMADTGAPTPPPRRQRAVYVISVAAELAGVHPQTLRIYERKGLLEPARTVGGSRRYSDDDIRLLQRIHDLTEDGLNLAGVKRVLELEQRLAETEAALAQSRRTRRPPSTRPIAPTGESSCP